MMVVKGEKEKFLKADGEKLAELAKRVQLCYSPIYGTVILVR